MSRTGSYSGGSTIIKVYLPRSTPSKNAGGALSCWIEDYRQRQERAARMHNRAQHAGVRYTVKKKQEGRSDLR